MLVLELIQNSVFFYEKVAEMAILNFMPKKHKWYIFVIEPDSGNELIN